MQAQNLHSKFDLQILPKPKSGDFTGHSSDLPDIPLAVVDTDPPTSSKLYGVVMGHVGPVWKTLFWGSRKISPPRPVLG